jgi:small membrane protein
MIIQVILVLFIIFAVSKVALRYKDKIISLQELVLWTIFWFLVGFVVIFPESTSYVANLVGVGRGVDLVIYLSVLILFYLVFRVLVRLDKTEKDITKVVRKVALDNKDKEK